MDWRDSADQAAFRESVRTFMQERLPPRYKAGAASYSQQEIPSPVETLIMPGASWETDRMSGDPEVRRQCQEWVEALNEQGWVAAHWPRELGGAGLSTIEQYILNEERTIADAPRVGGTGAMFLGSLLMVHGTPEQQARHILHGLLSPWYGPPSYETASHCGASAMIVYLQKGPIRAKHHGIADTLDRAAARARARRRGGVHGRR